MFASLPRDWPTLQRMAKRMETECDTKLRLLTIPDLNSHSNLISSQSTTTTTTISTMSQFHTMSTNLSELESMFHKLHQVIDQMESTLTPTSPSASFHVVQRFRDTLQTQLRELKRFKTSFLAARAHAELFNQAQSDRNSKKDTSEYSSQDSLIEERIQVDRATFMVDDLIDQAHATRSSLFEQRSTLKRAQHRLQNLDWLGLKNILSRIRWRRYKNTFILSCVVMLCLFAFYYYVFR